MKAKNYCENCKFWSQWCAGIHGDCEVGDKPIYFLHPHHTCEKFEDVGIRIGDSLLCVNTEGKYQYMVFGELYKVLSISCRRTEPKKTFVKVMAQEYPRPYRKTEVWVPLENFIDPLKGLNEAQS